MSVEWPKMLLGVCLAQGLTLLRGLMLSYAGNPPTP